MIFVVIGKDYKDALDRRMEVREQHLGRIKTMKEQGKIVFVSAFLDEDDGHLNGGVMVFDVESREVLDEILKTEPYLLNKVYESLEIIEGRIPDLT